jgi:23S rRNA (guanosine2251-2'-O)-methyltransferase
MHKKSMDQLERLSVEDFKQTPKNGIIIVLEDVRSMHNVGSVFRTADAFLVEEIILTGVSPQPPHRDIHKTALGATECVSWRYEQNAVEPVQKLKEAGYKIISVEQVHKSVMLNEYKILPSEKIVLVFGNEVNGVSEELIEVSDVCLEIPQYGSKHSFNISVSVGIVLWEFMRNK